MLTTVRRICGRIMHSQTALRSQWDKGWKNNSQFASPSIRRPTASLEEIRNAGYYRRDCLKTMHLNSKYWL